MSLQIAPPPAPGTEQILSPQALGFVQTLHRRFGPRRTELLAARAARPAPRGFLAETRHIREDPDWRCAAVRPDYADRRVEITGPTDRKLVINALNSGDGFDGTWVAHPDVVPVALEPFDAVLGERPNQIERRRDEVSVTEGQLLDAASTPGQITEAGLRNDVRVGFQYISFWLGGRGAAGINNLMEDAATAEIGTSDGAR